MKIRVSQPALVPDLVEFWLGVLHDRVGARLRAEVALPSVSDSARAARARPLPAWRGLHPPVEATIIDTRSAALAGDSGVRTPSPNSASRRSASSRNERAAGETGA